MYFKITGQPVGKMRPRTTARNGFVQVYSHKTQREWEKRAEQEIRAQNGEKEPLNGAVFLLVLSVFSRPARLRRKKDPIVLIWKTTTPDHDNTLKSASDALQNANVMINDSQVVMSIPITVYSEREGEPRTEIWVFTHWEGLIVRSRLVAQSVAYQI